MGCQGSAYQAEKAIVEDPLGNEELESLTKPPNSIKNAEDAIETDMKNLKLTVSRQKELDQDIMLDIGRNVVFEDTALELPPVENNVNELDEKDNYIAFSSFLSIYKVL